MLRIRGLALSPKDGGGADGNGNGDGEPETPPEATGKKAKGGPAPVPYDVFKATNAKLVTSETERATLQAKLEAREGWKPPKEVESLLAAERAKGESLLLLADKGVAPKYRGYMLDRLTTEAPDDPGTFLDQLRGTETAFFGDQTEDSPPAAKELRAPPKSNPDGGAGSPAPGDGRAVSAADIDAMSVPEYLAWKKAGGLDRARATATP